MMLQKSPGVKFCAKTNAKRKLEKVTVAGCCGGKEGSSSGERREVKKGYWGQKENRKKPGRIITKGINSKCDVEGVK